MDADASPSRIVVRRRGANAITFSCWTLFEGGPDLTDDSQYRSHGTYAYRRSLPSSFAFFQELSNRTAFLPYVWEPSKETCLASAAGLALGF